MLFLVHCSSEVFCPYRMIENCSCQLTSSCEYQRPRRNPNLFYGNIIAAKTSEQPANGELPPQPEHLQQIKFEMPGEGVFMEWACTNGINCMHAALIYDWFASHIKH
jgi:hypothetical protein